MREAGHQEKKKDAKRGAQAGKKRTRKKGAKRTSPRKVWWGEKFFLVKTETGVSGIPRVGKKNRRRGPKRLRIGKLGKRPVV